MINEKNKPFAISILLLFLAIPLFFLNIHTSHSLGDDFAQYIKEAENISKGKPYYQSAYVFNSAEWEYAPPQYPPGFPILLAPVVAIFGIAIKPMMYFNSCIVAGLLFALFAYFRKRTGTIAALCLATIIVYGDLVLELKRSVLSDIPCLLFIVLYLTARDRVSFSRWRIVQLILLAAMTILIRTQAVILLCAEGIFFLIEVVRLLSAKDFSIRKISGNVSLQVIAGTSLLVVFIDSVVFPAPVSALGFYLHMVTHKTMTFSEFVEGNINYFFSLLKDFFKFGDVSRLLRPLEVLMEHASVVTGLAGFFLFVRKNIRVDDLFFILMCLMIILIPERQGVRFLVEVFPIYVFYCYCFVTAIIRPVSKNIEKGLMITMTLVYLLIGSRSYSQYFVSKCEGCVPSPVISVFVDYIKANVDDSDAIVFPKPRLLALYTNKRSLIYARSISDEENKKKLHELKVKYFMPWYDNEMRKFMRRNYAIIDSQVLGDAILYRVEK